MDDLPPLSSPEQLPLTVAEMALGSVLDELEATDALSKLRLPKSLTAKLRDAGYDTVGEVLREDPLQLIVLPGLGQPALQVLVKHLNRPSGESGSREAKGTIFRMEHVMLDLLMEMRSAIADLPDRGRQIIVGRYGLKASVEPMTLEQLGNELGITRERVRQVQAQTLTKWKSRWSPGKDVRERAAHVREALSGDKEQEEFDVWLESLTQCGLSDNQARSWLRLSDQAFGASVPRPEDAVNATASAYAMFQRLEAKSAGGVVFRKPFEEAMSSSKSPSRCWSALRRAENLLVLDDACMSPTYASLAYYVFAIAPDPLHWREAYERADEFHSERFLHATSFYNCVSDSELFVRISPGTYTLAERGTAPKPRQKDLLIDVLEENGSPMPVGAVQVRLSDKDHEMKFSSLKMNLDFNLAFYQSLDAAYGLRDWLPDEQRIDTPRMFRESPESRKRFGTPLRRIKMRRASLVTQLEELESIGDEKSGKPGGDSKRAEGVREDLREVESEIAYLESGLEPPSRSRRVSYTDLRARLLRLHVGEEQDLPCVAEESPAALRKHLLRAARAVGASINVSLNTDSVSFQLERLAAPGKLSPRKDLAEILREQGLEIVDRRPKNGRLWVLGGAELNAILNSHGFNFVPTGGTASKGRPAWFLPS